MDTTNRTDLEEMFQNDSLGVDKTAMLGRVALALEHVAEAIECGFYGSRKSVTEGGHPGAVERISMIMEDVAKGLESVAAATSEVAEEVKGVAFSLPLDPPRDKK